MGFVDYGRSYRQAMLAEFRGQRSAGRFSKFLNKFGALIVGAGCVAMIWVWVGVFTPQKYTMADMRSYAVWYMNWSFNK